MAFVLRIKLVVTLLFLSAGYSLLAQQPTNTDTKQSYVTVNVPRAPESAAFEKYGTTQVNEFTGTTNIAIPIYTLKSRSLEVPVTLSYQATGIKVSQEASWVGLGFDLIAGGRITVETRGCADFNGSTWGLTSPTNLATGMLGIFNRLGGHNENAILTPATICEGASCTGNDPGFYNTQAVSDMTQFGVGEPDIFRANFMGHSIAFYFDKTTPNLDLKWLGEQSSYMVTKTMDATGKEIASWLIKDNDGIAYYFNLIETSGHNNFSNIVSPPQSTSAWLLTKVVHPNGDYINFNYTNYGSTVPAFTMASAIKVPLSTYAYTPVTDNDQTFATIIQNPNYLTRMETPDIAVDFLLDTRTDLAGPGAKRLNQIKITDKNTGKVKKTATFNYSYFQSAVNTASRSYLSGLTYSFSASVTTTANYLACSSSRLKLDSVNVNDNTYQPPYRFNYNATVADKFTMSQDHWGYYNGVNNSGNGYSFTHMIPFFSFGVQTAANSSFATAISSSFNLGVSRECDPVLMQAMMLNKITYPTGGSSEFIYEPHQSVMLPIQPGVTGNINVTGGGLRIKTINNYENSIFLNSMNYTYTGGKYMGTIKYFTNSIELAKCSGDGNFLGYYKLSSNGAINYNDILLGYNQITVTQKDPGGQPNGSVVKTFNINTPSSNYSYGVGYDLVAPYAPPAETACLNALTFDQILDPVYKSFAPTPSNSLEGKLTKEQYFDNSGNQLKSVDYYYRLANYTNNFYDIRAIQNRDGGFNNMCSTSPNAGWGGCGNRPVILFVSPAKSYRTLTDSVVETNYSNGISIKNRKYLSYNGYYQTSGEQLFNSDGTSTAVTYQRPPDILALSSPPAIILQMMGAHIYNPVFTTTVTRNSTPISVATNNYFNPSAGVYVPQNTQIKIAGNPIETRQVYNSYDKYGHLQEKQLTNGKKEIYLWGYDTTYLVASIVAPDSYSYSAAAALVNNTILNAPANDAALRTELNNLRTGLPNALVTTYTYDFVYGLSSVTDPAGRTNYYFYDGIGRLLYIQDQDLNVVKRFAYNFAGQAEGITSLVTTTASSANSTTTPWAAVFTNTITGVVYTYNINPNAGTNTFFGNVPLGNYNISFTPQFALSNPAQLIFNGITYTGNSFSLTNAAINSASTFTLQPGPVPCSFTMKPGYTSPTNSITNNGNSTVSGNFTFVSSSSIVPGTTYWVATINGSCIPSVTRVSTFTSFGRTWTVTISTTGRMDWKLNTGPGIVTVNANTAISWSSMSYAL
jgi:hypothetical protein